MATVAFGPHIHKVMKQVHPNLSFTRQGMCVVESMMFDIARTLTAQTHSQAVELGYTEINLNTALAAVTAIVPGALAQHAHSEGIKACSSFSRMPRGEPIAVGQNDADIVVEFDANPKLPRGASYGLAFPAGKVAQILRDSPTSSGLPIHSSAVICLTAVLEYLSAEILELSGNSAVLFAQANKQTPFVNPDHVRTAIQGDSELTQLLVICASTDPILIKVSDAPVERHLYPQSDRVWNFDVESDDESAPTLSEP